MVTVVARYRAKPGAGDTVADVLTKHVAATRAEPGCVQFDACRSIDDPDEFVLYEKYVDDAAFESHRQSSHFKEFIVDMVVPALAERAWKLYREVEAAG